MRHIQLETRDPINLFKTFRMLQFGARDPTCRVTSNSVTLGVFTPEGPGSIKYTYEASNSVASNRFNVHTDGAGKEYLLHRAKAIIGDDDLSHHFTPGCAITRRLVRSCMGLKLATAASPFDALVRIIFQQRVAWKDASYSYRHLLTLYGTVLTGENPVLIPPSPKQWLGIPLSDFSALGVDQRRANTVREAAKLGFRVDKLLQVSPTTAEQWLHSVPGLGPWTIQNFLGQALGYPDAVPTGDYDLPHRVAMLFRRQARSTDEEMLHILEPYRGQRWRVLRMIYECGPPLTRYAPRKKGGPRPRFAPRLRRRWRE